MDFYLLKSYFSYSIQIKFKKITNIRLSNKSRPLNIDKSRIKNVTAKQLYTFVLMNLVKALCKFQVIWMKNKKIFMDFSAKIDSFEKTYN